jgi:hypothetical protein
MALCMPSGDVFLVRNVEHPELWDSRAVHTWSRAVPFVDLRAASSVLNAEPNPQPDNGTQPRCRRPTTPQLQVAR